MKNQSVLLRKFIFFTVALLPLFAVEAQAIEKAKYEVIESDENIELRQYAPRIVAETFVAGDFKEVGNVGFRRLFDYINGNNIKNQNIAMTAPVTQEAESEKIAMTAPATQERSQDQWRITFLMPAQYTMETLPKPLDPLVRLTEEPGYLMAAIRYSGTWSQKGFEQNKSRLQAAIKKRGLKPVGQPVWARYDPPFMPWFLRRNEVLIRVQD
ncbi:MAG: heme-binding protein [Desulfobacterales bacterium]|jgi:hypothetical protein|nr:heme-binding protein [Deltaproteobacteria bacterium]